MSIFAVIKYPIDERWQESDLARIPRTVLEGWWEYLVHKERNQPKNPKTIRIHSTALEPHILSNYMNNHMRIGARKFYLLRLRERIMEIDE